MKTTTFLATTAGALLLCSTAAAPAVAQGVAPASSTKGFFVGAHLNGSSLTADDFNDETQDGGGAGLHLGYGFTSRLALVTEFTVAALDDGNGGDIGFGHFDLGLRYAWTSPTRRWVPSLELGVTGRALAQEDAVLDDGEPHDVSLSGAGFTVGGGIQYYVSPKLALGAMVKFTGGELDRFKVDNVSIDDLNIDASSTRVNLGITWYPMAGR